jgi:hypothetical protein
MSMTGSRTASTTISVRPTADHDDEMADPREPGQSSDVTRSERDELRRERAEVREQNALRTAARENDNARRAGPIMAGVMPGTILATARERSRRRNQRAKRITWHGVCSPV